LLWNATDSTIEELGSSEETNIAQSRSVGKALVVITAAKAFEIRHECFTSQTTSGFGKAGNFNAEVYTTVDITKVATT
jgi:hypothetical protein